MKRIFLFLVVNLAVMLVLTVVYSVLSAYLGGGETGMDLASLALFSLVFGAGGAVISLLISKPMAKWSTNARVVDGSEGPRERWLVDTVERLARTAGIACPEVAIYPGEANAFATGAFRNHALVAVSTDIMGQMTREELEAVLGHEISHVSNGDMVTLTLVQGVLNACVLFLSRLVARVVDGALGARGEGGRRHSSGAYWLIAHLLQIVLGILASLIVCAYSRRREYAADAGSARLLGTPYRMIAALRRLGGLEAGVLPDSLKAMGISGGHASLFATHPSLEDRIAALERLTVSA